MDVLDHPRAGSLKLRLRELLVKLFGTAEDLRNFLAHCEDRGQPLDELLVTHLPGPNVSLQAYVAEAAEGLYHRGLVTEVLLNALASVRPGQRADIETFARLAGLSLRNVPSRGVCEAVALGSSLSGDPFAPFAAFAGRETERSELVSLLREGHSALLIGGRRAGKTALSRKIAREDIKRVIYRADAATLHGSDEGALVRWLGRAFQQHVDSRDELEDALRASAPLSLVIDEAERLLGYPWTNAFLAWLRYLDDVGMASGLSVLLIGGPELECYRDFESEPTRVHGSPVLNNCYRVYLRPLAPDARRSLVRLLGRSVDERRLFDAVSGHPWLLVKTLSRMWRGMDLDAALNDVARNSLGHFETWRRQLGVSGLQLLLEHIPEGGVARAEFDEYPTEGSLCSWVQEWIRLQCLCLVDERDGRVHRGPSMVMRYWQRQHPKGGGR